MPALTITKTADTATVVAGSAVHYTVTVTNTGETAYAGATVTDALAGVLDDATYQDDATATIGTVDYADAAADLDRRSRGRRRPRRSPTR